MKEKNTRSSARRRDAELEILTQLSDIDTSDIPEVKDWSRAVVGKFYRPIKRPLTIRLDADVLAWLKSQGKGYQTRLNHWLRLAMERQARRWPRGRSDPRRP